MDFRRPRPAKQPQERLLPLINVVFLLLIFFMLAGHLASSDAFKVQPPQSTSQDPLDEPALIILLGADGRLAVDDQETDKAGLKSLIEAKLDTAGLTEVILRADSDTEAVRVVAIMDILRQAGVAELELVTVLAQP